MWRVCQPCRFSNILKWSMKSKKEIGLEDLLDPATDVRSIEQNKLKLSSADLLWCVVRRNVSEGEGIGELLGYDEPLDVPSTVVTHEQFTALVPNNGKMITARKRSLRRLCFYTCLSVILFGGYPSMHCRWYPSMPCRSPGLHQGGS